MPCDARQWKAFMNKIDLLLLDLVARSGSDLHLSAGRRPYMRVQGTLTEEGKDEKPFSSDEVLSMVQEIVPKENSDQLLREWDTDCAYAIPGVARFRVNCFKDMVGYCAVLRVIPDKIPTFEELSLPPALREFCLLSKGLVVVTGPTGSGKSTTLSAMIDFINRTRNEHIITIEDPIEFVHTPDQCVINQREIHRDTLNFTQALRAALREDPDIVLVGEIRDLETMEIAIETAETGHLVFATLHTNTAASTVERMIDKFPADRQNQIRAMLADTLKGVVAQTLCKKISGGRIAAFEVLVVNTPVATLIREGKTHMLPSVMQTGSKVGMMTFSDELTRLALNGDITVRDAYVKAVNKDEIEAKFRTVGLPFDFKKQEDSERLRVRQECVEAQLKEFRARLFMMPDDLPTIDSLAWILATSFFKSLRNGKEALKYAERAVSLTKEKDAAALAVLGVAHAECAHFHRAVDATRKALALYQATGATQEAVVLKHRLTLFEKKQPFHEI